MFIGLGMGVTIPGQSLESQALAIARKYSASVYLPATENFSDSALTSVAVNDGSVGGVKGQGLGPELVTNGGFDSATGWTLFGDSGSISGGVATLTRTSVYTIYERTINVIANVAYTVTFSSRRLSGTGNLSVALRTASNTGGVVIGSIANPAPSSVFAETTGIFVATTTGTLYVQAGIGTNPAVAEFDNISVRELGYIATQSTAGFKPLLVGGARNLLLNSATLGTQSVTCAATAYTLAFAGTGTVTLSGASTAGPLVGTGASNRVSLTFTPTAGSVTFTVSGSVTSAQLNLGSVAEPYVPTTSAAASSGSRPKAWLFDGTDDRLSLSGPLFQMSDDHFVVACAKPFSYGTGLYLFSERDVASTNPIVAGLRISSGGNIQCLWRDNAGTIDQPATVGVATIGSVSVASATKIGNNKTVRLNGSGAVTASTEMGATTLTNATIGATITTTTGAFFTGNMYGVIAGKGTISDAELLILERYLGSLGNLQI